MRSVAAGDIRVVDKDQWLARVRATWNARAAHWDEQSEQHARSADRARELDRLEQAPALRPGARILDAGCGTGQYAIAFAERGYRVTAIDLAPEMIERARRRADERGVRVEWRTGDISQLSDPLAVYDAIHARVVLHFVPDVASTLREFRRVLVPGGRLFASVPGALSPIYRHAWRRFVDPGEAGTNLMTPWELEAVLEALGWRIVDGWGDFSQSFSGEANPFDPAVVSSLDRRLQQAAATTWGVVAR